MMNRIVNSVRGLMSMNKLNALIALCLMVGIALTASAAQITLYEPFNAPTWQQNWTTIEHPENATKVDYVPNSGGALRINVPQGQRHGAALVWAFAQEGYTEPTEAWIRFYVYFDSSWQSTPHRPYLSSLPGFHGKDWAWALHMYASSTDTNALVGFHAHTPGMSHGEAFPVAYNLVRNQWYAFEFRVKLNTPGFADGIVQGWLNNGLVFDKRDFVFRVDPGVTIEAAWAGIYLPTGSVADRNMALYLDAISVSFDQISGSAQPPPADPTPPPTPPPPAPCPCKP